VKSERRTSVSNSPSQSFAPLADTSLGAQPTFDLGEDDIIADGGTQIMAGGLADLGDEDIIADGGTQIMSREPEPAAVAPIPLAPETARIHDLDPDDLEEEELKRSYSSASSRGRSYSSASSRKRSYSSASSRERTQPFDRSRIFGAASATPASLPPVAGAVHVTPQPTAAAFLVQPPPYAARPTTGTLPSAKMLPLHHLPSVVITELPPVQNRPGSIAPLAIDVGPVPLAPDATLKLPPIRPRPVVAKNQTLLAAAIGSGIAVCAAAVIALVAFRSTDDIGRSAPTVTGATRPREAQKGAIRSAVIEKPETTPQKAAAPEGTRDEDGTPVFSASSLPSAPPLGHAASADGHGFVSSTPAGAPANPGRVASAPRTTIPPKAAAEPVPPPAAPTPAPAPVAPRAVPTTGAIEVPGALMTVMVDGDYKRVQGGRIVVSCGKHRVNAGRGTQVIDVPCGGVASVM
jgi:hypothetical protein